MQSAVQTGYKKEFPGIYFPTDYYPFGMGMVERGDDGGYRYGFNGKEKDGEGMGGGGSTYDYGFRIYNPGLGKFLSVDPLSQEYPYYTPYQFAGNKVVMAIDLDGLEEYHVVYHYNSKNDVTAIDVVRIKKANGGLEDMQLIDSKGKRRTYQKVLISHRYTNGNIQYSEASSLNSEQLEALAKGNLIVQAPIRKGNDLTEKSDPKAMASDDGTFLVSRLLKLKPITKPKPPARFKVGKEIDLGHSNYDPGTGHLGHQFENDLDQIISDAHAQGNVKEIIISISIWTDKSRPATYQNNLVFGAERLEGQIRSYISINGGLPNGASLMINRPRNPSELKDNSKGTIKSSSIKVEVK